MKHPREFLMAIHEQWRDVWMQSVLFCGIPVSGKKVYSPVVEINPNFHVVIFLAICNGMSDCKTITTKVGKFFVYQVDEKLVTLSLNHERSRDIP